MSEIASLYQRAQKAERTGMWELAYDLIREAFFKVMAMKQRVRTDDPKAFFADLTRRTGEQVNVRHICDDLYEYELTKPPPPLLERRKKRDEEES